MSDSKAKTVKDPKTGQFAKGHKPLGRPKGSPNKVKISLNDVLSSADKHSPQALQFLLDVLEGKVAKASVTNKMGAAVRILEMAYKFKSATEKTEATDGAMKDLADDEVDDTPMISLRAVN